MWEVERNLAYLRGHGASRLAAQQRHQLLRPGPVLLLRQACDGHPRRVPQLLPSVLLHSPVTWSARLPPAWFAGKLEGGHRDSTIGPLPAQLPAGNYTQVWATSYHTQQGQYADWGSLWKGRCSRGGGGRNERTWSRRRRRRSLHSSSSTTSGRTAWISSWISWQDSLDT